MNMPNDRQHQQLKLLPEQISSYREIVQKNCAYIDKTSFIESLEIKNFVKVPLFLRPRRFGKTLFTDLLAEYYDIASAGDFDRLFGHTYIGSHPTPGRNSLYILRFDFSGISSRDLERNFRDSVDQSLHDFCTRYRQLNLSYQTSADAASLIGFFFSAFKKCRPSPDDRLFIIIDQYDNFASDILATDSQQFADMTSADGFVKCFYARLKAESKNSQSAIERFFITGVSSIMLSSVTSGFDYKNISQQPEFSQIAGFTEPELRELIRQSLDMDRFRSAFTEEQLVEVMKRNYDGYSFSEDCGTHMFNSSLCVSYLSRVRSLGRLSGNFSDPSICLDLSKFSRLMETVSKEAREKLVKIVAHADDPGEHIPPDLEENLNINARAGFSFGQGVSLLYYLGFLTYGRAEDGSLIFQVPNLLYRHIFLQYYLSLFFTSSLSSANFRAVREMEETGDIAGFVRSVERVLSGILPDNEKDVTERSVVSIAGTLILSYLEHSTVTVEYPVCRDGLRTRDRADLVILNRIPDKPSFLFEFKFCRETAVHSEATRKSSIEKRRKEAWDQIPKYLADDTLKTVPSLRCYVMIYAYGELSCEEWSP